MLQTHAIGDFLRHWLNLNTDPTTADASLVLELSDDVLHRRRWDRKCDADAATGWRINRSVHANDFALHIERRTSRIALVDRRVDLDEIVVWTTSDVPTARRNNPSSYAATKAKRVADRKHPIASPSFALRQSYKWEVWTSVHFDQSQVGPRIGSDYLRSIVLSAISRYFDLLGAIDDVIVR